VNDRRLTFQMGFELRLDCTPQKTARTRVIEALREPLGPGSRLLGGVTVRDLAIFAELPERRVRKVLMILLAEGAVRRGFAPGSRLTYWRLVQ